jgi:hypothetical protein
MRYRLDAPFDQWASKPEVQAQARAFICSHIDDGERLLANLEVKFFGSRLMNFKVIEAMNQLFWKCEEELMQAAVFSRGDFNALAMQPDPEWRKVVPIFAFALGFRPEDEGSQAPTGKPQILPA